MHLEQVRWSRKTTALIKSLDFESGNVYWQISRENDQNFFAKGQSNGCEIQQGSLFHSAPYWNDFELSFEMKTKFHETSLTNFVKRWYHSFLIMEKFSFLVVIEQGEKFSSPEGGLNDDWPPPHLRSKHNV